jgi:hypothetical protein
MALTCALVWPALLETLKRCPIRCDYPDGSASHHLRRNMDRIVITGMGTLNPLGLTVEES